MSVLELRNKLAREFKCPICKNDGAFTNLITVGTEWKKDLSKFQNFDFIIVTCKQCGCSDMYDMYFIER